MEAGGPKGDLFGGWGDFGGPSNLKGTLKETKGEVPPRGTLFGDYVHEYISESTPSSAHSNLIV